MSSFAGAIVSDPSPLIIEELTGDRNQLQLIGRCLPYRPLSFEGSMRAEVTWYPGNPTATLQMLGAEESPTAINGMWKDRFIRATNDFGVPVVVGRTGIAVLNGSPIPNVRSLVAITDEFRLRGQLLELRWDEHTRIGYLKRFRHVWLRREDVEWEMEFQWINRGEAIPPVGFAPPVASLDVANEIIDAVDSLINTSNTRIVTTDPEIDETDIPLVSDIEQQINDALDTLEQAATSVADTAAKESEGTLSKLEATQLTLAAFQTIKSTSDDLLDTTESTPPRALQVSAPPTVDAVAPQGPTQATQITSGTETAGIASLTHEQALNAAKYKRDMDLAARNVRAIATRRELELAAQSIRVPKVTTFVVGDDDDLRDISTRFYGTAEEWKRLLTYNNLSTSKLAAGQIILVPPFNTPD